MMLHAHKIVAQSKKSQNYLIFNEILSKILLPFMLKRKNEKRGEETFNLRYGI